MARETVPWDAADTLRSKEDIAAYLDAVLEDGDPELLKAALAGIARAKGMTEIARDFKAWPRQPLQSAIAKGQPRACDRCQGAKGSWAAAFRFEPLTCRRLFPCVSQKRQSPQRQLPSPSR